MSDESLWTTCWPVFGLLAVEVVLLVSIAALIAGRVMTAAWRRTIWQGCIVALLGLLALEFSGSARSVAAFAAGHGRVARQEIKVPAPDARDRTATTPVPLQAVSLNQNSVPGAGDPPSLAEPAAGVPTPAREDARPTPPIAPETSAGIRSPVLEGVSKMGGAGHWPAPVGDPPTGTGAAVPTHRPSSIAGDALPVPSGESPDGTGQWPVLPSQFPNTL